VRGGAGKVLGIRGRAFCGASPDQFIAYRELASLAQGINADPAAWKECLDSGQFAETIKNEMSEAEALQISGTPTIFIDSKRHEGSVSYKDLKDLLANHPT
jgi:protein-disulfide isomerase